MRLANLRFMQTRSRYVLGNDPEPDVAEYTKKVNSAMRSGLSLWQVQAKFADIKIMALSAIGAPGCLKGPDLGSLVTTFCPRETKWERDMNKVVAAAIGSAWSAYQGSVSVPGLPWYPAFVAWPGPMAPPMPNVPTPFLALPQQGAATVARSIKRSIEKSSLAYAENVALAVSTGFQAGFFSWIGGVMVKNVLGKGPVPSFAPPYVPVGPVVNGDIISIPGHLAS